MIFLYRHGQTQWNVERLIQGISDIPLNEKGRRQAKRAAQVLTGSTFDAVLCSPLKRAAETGEILASGITAPQPIIDERLRERAFGRYEGFYAGKKPFSAYLDAVDSAEPMAEVEARMLSCVQDAAKAYNGHVLMASHGAAIGALIRHYAPQYREEPFRLVNLSCIMIDPTSGALIGFNMPDDEIKKALVLS